MVYYNDYLFYYSYSDITFNATTLVRYYNLTTTCTITTTKFKDSNMTLFDNLTNKHKAVGIIAMIARVIFTFAFNGFISLTKSRTNLE